MTANFSKPAGGARTAADSYTRALLDLLGSRDPLAVQAELPVAIEQAVSGLSDAAVRRPERPGKWSVIQVIQHLADSELVSGYRIRMILAHDTPVIQGYDQDAWAERLRYADVPLSDALTQIRVLRTLNLRLLHALSPAEWERTGNHSERGPESIARFTKLIAGHDLVHRRQIDRIKSSTDQG